MSALAELRAALASHGLAITGMFAPGPEDGAPEGCRSLCLVGADGGAMWAAFSISAEARDGLADPLDRWSQRVLGAVAASVGGVALFPFGGPPYMPFLAWGQRAEGARPSPVGMMVSASRGLWVSWRGAIALPAAIPQEPVGLGDPCMGCAAPCLTACPVAALGPDQPYDVARCTAYLQTPEGASCRERGCKVRHACPAGRNATPPAAQCAFHMTAFLARHARPD